MRKYSLRQAANRYLKTENRGSYRDKKHRAFVIHKMIDGLFIIDNIPSSFKTLNSTHIHQLISHWQKQKLKPATIMRYMTIIRNFLSDMNCHLLDIDNKTLGLIRQYPLKSKAKINSKFLQLFTEKSVCLVMAMQVNFGLTFSEAIHFIPDIHFREHRLWITREIAFNSLDRTIPIRNEIQKRTLSELIQLTQGNQSLLHLHGYDKLRRLWREELTKCKLPSNKNYRYLYAQTLNKELSPILGHYQTNWLIRDELGIKSRNTLWLYLNE
ncbi:phage integrase N-terminal domain-containing protein [Legionella erythra]|uniref:Putative integrase N-terminal domain-containing protein n=1 Tax=Legionella erythra TaxID=448 RepID=A0A0W0TGK8_LEGER|nr:phage integrase N-terminal domain-containing protein [Legionella erythra]KTC94711.1 hypothetical protein Lery_2878 [Legionella erythra]